MIPFLCLLTMTCSHSPGHCQPLLFPPGPRALLTDLLAGHPSPLLYHCKGLLPSLCWTGHWSWLDFTRFLLAQSSSLPRSFWMAALLLSVLPCPPVGCHLQLRSECTHLFHPTQTVKSIQSLPEIYTEHTHLPCST